MPSERLILDGIRERDARTHPSWFDADYNEQMGALRVDWRLVTGAIRDRRWLLARVEQATRLLTWQAMSGSPPHEDRCRWYNHSNEDHSNCVHEPWWDCPFCDCGLRDLMARLTEEEPDRE